MAIKIKKEKEGKGFEWIEVHSVHEINVVKVYNKEIEKQRKRDQAYHSRCVSMDQLFDEHDFEFSSDEPSILDRLIEEEEKEEERRLIFNAIRELTLIQDGLNKEYKNLGFKRPKDVYGYFTDKDIEFFKSLENKKDAEM